jgi:hypothetical protein
MNIMTHTFDAGLHRRAMTLGIGMLLLLATGARAEEGTPAERDACKPDVFRLCRAFIPDPKAITGCLEANRAKLSPACHAVFAPR